MQATARGYEKSVEELKRRKRGRENEARMVAIYLGRQLGGHKHEEIGKTVGLGKASSVSSAYLLMKERVATEKQLQQRVRKIEEALTKSKKADFSSGASRPSNRSSCMNAPVYGLKL